MFKDKECQRIGGRYASGVCFSKCRHNGRKGRTLFFGCDDSRGQQAVMSERKRFFIGHQE